MLEQDAFSDPVNEGEAMLVNADGGVHSSVQVIVTKPPGKIDPHCWC